MHPAIQKTRPRPENGRHWQSSTALPIRLSNAWNLGIVPAPWFVLIQIDRHKNLQHAPQARAVLASPVVLRKYLTLTSRQVQYLGPPPERLGRLMNSTGVVGDVGVRTPALSSWGSTSLVSLGVLQPSLAPRAGGDPSPSHVLVSMPPLPETIQSRKVSNQQPFHLNLRWGN